MTLAPPRGTPKPSGSPAAGVDASTQQLLDSTVAGLKAHRGDWVRVSVGERIALLDELIHGFLAVADRWTAACLAAEGLDPSHPSSGEEALVGPYFILRNLRLLKKSLQGIAADGAPRIPGPVKTLPNGQVSARVFPQDLYDRLFYTGVTAEVWMQPGVSAAELPATQAVAYQKKDAGGVCLVLGAGNVSSIGPMDALYKLFVDDRVVVYKVHPVNVYLGPLLEEGFRALIDRGFLRQAYGGAAEGAYLCRHEDVDEIHITGSDKTYEAIVFGSGPEGEARKRDNRPVITKPISAELGNVSPVIVVPGPWSEGDLAYHAENLVTMLTNNAGFNCNATRVIVTHAGWSQRGALLDRIQRLLARVPTRKAYYPGAQDRYEAFLHEHPEAKVFGDAQGDRLAWAFIPGLDAARRDDICYSTEAFVGLFGEAPLVAASAADFVDQAVAFCNDRLWGTLNATLLVHPKSLADPAVAQAVERAIARLRYGTVAINHWAAIGYGLVITPWGAYPGHERTDIQSGTGVVHNTLMFSRVEKSVVRAPFRVLPKPVWFVTHRTAHKLTPKLSRFEAAPSPAKLPGIFALALRG
ncbi:MAG TPA: aldehyde dehydrogenase family protein [Thermoanaerobaculia bacterium]|nr:aldehyde dehydrogenase family protein [Thermoanaerobaculia bacterium]